MSPSVDITPVHLKMTSAFIIRDEGTILIFPSIPSGKPSLPFWADDPEEALRSIKKLIDNASGKIYIAHGRAYSSAEVKESFRALFEGSKK